MDGDGDADQRHGDEDPAQGVEIRHKGQDGRLRFRKDLLRDFHSGMDRRTIDWKQSARHHHLLAKEFRVERNHQIIMALDCGRVMSEPVGGAPRIDRAIIQKPYLDQFLQQKMREVVPYDEGLQSLHMVAMPLMR